MKFIVITIILAMLVISAAGCAPGKAQRDTFYETTPFITLTDGFFEGNATIGTIRKHGDFGLGTFNNLDGEMVILENEVYQIRADGKAYPVPDSTLSPFAEVTYLDPDIRLDINNISSFADLQKYLDSQLPTLNTIWAIELKATFPYIKTRSFDPFQKPYPILNEAVKSQHTFDFKDVSGTIVGFRAPGYIGPVNVAGYHFHFISDDREAGGHVLDVKINKAAAIFDETGYFYMEIPMAPGVDKANLSPDGDASAAE